MTKPCKKCGVVKALDEFVSRPRLKDGRTGTCKACHAKISREYAAAHPEQIAATRKKHRRAHPEKHREHVKRNRANHPEARKRREERYRQRHPERIAAAWSRWAEANPERVRERARQGTARRRARKRGGLPAIVPIETWQLLCAAFDGLCAWCSAAKQEHLDHVVPLSRGGAHVIGNVVPSCAACNWKKRNRDPRAWAERCGVSLESVFERALISTAPIGQNGNENAL